jgi:hypothetical protein
MFGHEKTMIDRNETRKPAVYLLVILPIMIGGGASLLIALVEAYSRVTGLARSAVPNQNGLLITLPALLMTYDLKDKEGRVCAFEVGNFLLTRGGLCRLVRRIPECRVTRRPSPLMRWSSEENEEFCEFEVDGVPFAACEPWGDNNRFWVGPNVKEGQTLQWSPAVDRVRAAFRMARPVFGIIMGQPPPANQPTPPAG